MSNKLLCGCEAICKGHEYSLLQPRILRDISYAEYRALDALVEACRELQEILTLPWQVELATGEELGIFEALAVVDRVRADEAKRS